MRQTMNVEVIGRLETERLSDQRNRDAVRSQAAAPRVHLDLPALVNRDGERWKKEDVAI